MSSASSSDLGDHHSRKDVLSPLAFVALMVASNKVDVRVLSVHPSNQIANIYWVFNLPDLVCRRQGLNRAPAFQQLTDL